MKPTSKNHFFDKFKWSNIFILNLKRSMALIAIPLIAINILSMTYYYKNISLEYSSSSNQILSSVENIISKTITECENIFNIISKEQGLSLLMQTERIESLTGSRATPLMDLKNMLETQIIYSGSISSIDIYSYNADYVLSSDRSGKINFITNKPWYNTDSDELFYMVKNGDSFCVCYNVVSNTQKTGLVIFNIDITSLEMAYMDLAGKNCDLILSGKDKAVFYSSDETLSKSTDFDIFGTETRIRQKNKFTEVYSATNDVFIKLVVEHTHPIFSQLIFMMLLSLILMAILSFVFAYILSKQLYRSIQEIALTINDVNSDNSPERVTDEIAYINQNILSMKRKNQMLEQELVKSFIELKKMQTKTMQMQFTPHFLFNALNTLNASIMLKLGVNNPESKSIETIAEMLTSSLDTTNYMVTVREEIDYCKKYVKIQSFISNNNFDINWDIQDDILNFMTVKFSLQPLIENAFKHGIRHLQNKVRGNLSICAHTEGNNLVFKIENNGPIPDANKIKELNDMLSSSVNADKNHVGLFNVNKRIHLIFGDNYGCSINVQNDLTVLKVVIPITTNTDVFKE